MKSFLSFVATIGGAIKSFFGLLDRAAQAYHDKQIKRAARNEIELDALKRSHQQQKDLKRRLDAVHSIDDVGWLRDDIWEDSDK